jgi:uncharacterized protein YegP (UPF0339 family)
MLIEIYKDNKKELRWRLVVRKKVIAVSSESHKRKGTMLKSLNNMIEKIGQANIQDLTLEKD